MARLPEVTALHYLTPLRGGGSLPGIVETDDLGTYVVKFGGAALIFHHRWSGADDATARRYPMTAHALGGCAPEVAAADAALAPLVTEELLTEVVALIPDEWLPDEPGFDSPEDQRAAYTTHLTARAARSAEWIPTEFATAEELAEAERRRIAATLAGRPAWLQHVRA